MSKKRKSVILLEKWGEESYQISQVRGTETISYYGKISLLANESHKQYAIIYDREIPALSGPPGERRQLLLAGSEKEFEVLQKDSLEKLTYEAALHEARRIARKERLTVRKKI
jgi:hypothetical protein